MIAVATLLIVVTITLVINRIGAIALVATGLSMEVAHFQARSALTGVGFTTSETELIVQHPSRRRIVLLLMLVGNAGLATIIATLVLGLTGEQDAGSLLLRIVTLIVGIVVLLLLFRSRRVDRGLTRLITAALRRFTTLDVRDFVQLLDLAADYTVAELAVESDSWVAERELTDLHLPQEGVLVLGVRRADGTFIGAPRGHTAIHEHDTLVVYGFADVIADLGRRKIGFEGDRAHAEFMETIVERQAAEDESDTG